MMDVHSLILVTRAIPLKLPGMAEEDWGFPSGNNDNPQYLSRLCLTFGPTISPLPGESLGNWSWVR